MICDNHSGFKGASAAKRLVLAALLFTVAFTAQGQNHVRKAMERAKAQREAMARQEANSDRPVNAKGEYLQMKVVDGDTTYYDKVPALWIIGRKKGSTEKQWRDYYKLVYRFARVYPYALAAAPIIHEADSVIAANHWGAVKKDRYIKDVQKQLFKNYEGAFRQLSIYDGALLMKLIDRETGMSSYDIIKEYKSGVAAGFWQGVAKLFENDLKSTYDPNGADADTELLVQAWHAGEFRSLYWSVFWDEPPVVTIGEINMRR